MFRGQLNTTGEGIRRDDSLVSLKGDFIAKCIIVEATKQWVIKYPQS